MPANKKANTINTDVTVMAVVPNGLGPSKLIVTPGGGWMVVVLLIPAGAIWSVIERANKEIGNCYNFLSLQVNRGFKRHTVGLSFEL